MSAKHTPGPWSLDSPRPGKALVWGGSQGRTWIADVHFTSDNDKANARLIAAAPELLEALMRLLAVADTVRPLIASADGTKAVPNARRFVNALRATRAAIAKATGESE